MLETDSFDLTEPKRKDGWTNFQAWTRKWNRVFATVFCVLSFALLFAIVVVNVIRAERDIIEDYEEENETYDQINLQLGVSLQNSIQIIDDTLLIDGCEYSGVCKVICQNIPIRNVAEEFRTLIKVKLCINIDLHLKNITFPDFVLPIDWFNITQTSISSLEISDSDTLEMIEPKAFNERSFRDTNSLRLKSLSLSSLAEGVFEGLFMLENLELINMQYLKSMEKDVMTPIARKITRIIVNNVGMCYFTNITGVVRLEELRMINFTNNNIRKCLSDQTFGKVPRLENLDLKSNKISALTRHVFTEISGTIKLIELQGNRLITLPTGIFSKMRTSFRIRLSGNHWRCDCDLIELRNLLNAKNTAAWFDDSPLCKMPFSVRNQPIRTAIFCEHEWTTTDGNSEITDPITESTHKELTTLPSVTSSTPSCTDDITVGTTQCPIECHICLVDPYVPITCDDSNNNIFLRQKSFEFVIEEVKTGVIEIQVKNKLNLEYALIWLSNHSPVEEQLETNNDEFIVDCNLPHFDKFRLTNLQENTLHMFCLKINDSEISPFDCLPYKTKPTKSTDPWLQQDDKIIAYTVSVLSLASCSFLGAFIMFLIIRRMPTLLKGSERVIVVKDKEVIVMPSNHKKMSKTGSIQSNVESIQSRPLPPSPAGYLTPVLFDPPTYRQIHHRRASDTSIESIRSYISAQALPTHENSIGITCYSDYQGRCFTDLRDVPNTPPPLPQRGSIEKTDYAKVRKNPDGNIYAQYDYGRTSISTVCQQ